MKKNKKSPRPKKAPRAPKKPKARAAAKQPSKIRPAAKNQKRPVKNARPPKTGQKKAVQKGGPKLTPAQIKAGLAKNKEKSIVITPQPAPKKAIARWGVIGGLFNPIHKGHLFIAQEAYQRYFLDKVIFVPCGQPPHRSNKGVAPAEDRVNMCRLAISPYPYFESSRIEVDRQGPSYALDTLKSLKFVPGREGSRDIFFIIGLDAFLEMPSWHKFRECLDLARWLVFIRPGTDQEKLKKALKKAPLKQYATRVYQVSANPPDISATDIRQAVQKRKDISALVPASVAAYIRDNKLYKK